MPATIKGMTSFEACGSNGSDDLEPVFNWKGFNPSILMHGVNKCDAMCLLLSK